MTATDNGTLFAIERECHGVRHWYVIDPDAEWGQRVKQFRTVRPDLPVVNMADANACSDEPDGGWWVPSDDCGPPTEADIARAAFSIDRAVLCYGIALYMPAEPEAEGTT